MKILKIVFVALMFYLLTPGILIALPPGASFQVQAAVHGVVFAVVVAIAWKFAKSYVA
jgi:hypothetical protein